MPNDEKWKGVEEFAEAYEVSNYGNVRRLAHAVKRSDGVITKLPGKPIRGTVSNNGYLTMTLNSIHKRYIHRLIAAAFIPNAENKPFVNHLNGDKTDNQVENLEWVTNAENCAHARKTGLNLQSGENCNLSRHSSLAIQAAKDLWATGNYNRTQIGLLLGITGVHIGEIIKGTTRKTG